MSIEPHSPTWLAVARTAHKSIETAQAKLEATGLDLASTEHARGYIAAMRDVLKLAQPDPVISAAPVDYED